MFIAVVDLQLFVYYAHLLLFIMRDTFKLVLNMFEAEM